eukprot:6060123-Pleurochrysis_carterae.AAC.1
MVLRLESQLTRCGARASVVPVSDLSLHKQITSIMLLQIQSTQRWQPPEIRFVVLSKEASATAQDTPDVCALNVYYSIAQYGSPSSGCCDDKITQSPAKDAPTRSAFFFLREQTAARDSSIILGSPWNSNLLATEASAAHSS